MQWCPNYQILMSTHTKIKLILDKLYFINYIINKGFEMEIKAKTLEEGLNKLSEKEIDQLEEGAEVKIILPGGILLYKLHDINQDIRPEIKVKSVAVQCTFKTAVNIHRFTHE